MKKIVFTLVLTISILLVGCASSSSNKILNIIELNKTPKDEIIDSFNLEIDVYEVWNEDENIYEWIYVWHYADYTLNNVKGTIRIRFENDTAQFVNYSADATKENMKQLLSYLTDTYGDKYEEAGDYITRWTVGNLIIDYALTDEDTVEVRWYNAE